MTIDKINTQAAVQSSGVVLTLKGERYVSEHDREALIRQEAEEIIEASFDLIERMLRVLDRLDGDADFEIDPADDEANVQPLTLNREGTE